MESDDVSAKTVEVMADRLTVHLRRVVHIIEGSPRAQDADAFY